MKYRYFVFVYILFVAATLSAQDSALSNRVANYKIEVELDEVNKITKAKEILLWRNPSADTIRDLQFHVYYNAFKNNRSTFMHESSGAFTSDVFLENCDWGKTDITSIIDQYGNDLTAAQSYIQPEGAHPQDQSVLRIALKTPVLPYDSIEVTLHWEAKIPKLMIRTGYNQDYFFMAQWFPKVGVYEPAGMRFAEKGQWNCHEYHRSTEYYSDFGVYEVSINVPENYIVGSSGKRTKDIKENGRKIVTHYVEDVIDFTWTAYPHFEVETRQWEHIELRLLHHPDRTCVVDRYFTAVQNALEYLDQHVGKYPYPTLTIIDPPFHGVRSSAMEYPTLFTGAGLYCFPEGIRTTESISTHELIHQYFMQMVASNEQEEAWLDEGFTAYYEARIIDHYYGKILEDPWTGFQASNKNWRRTRYMSSSNPKVDIPGQAGWKFEHGNAHSIIYGKTALALQTLEGLIGIETMDKVMQTYFERWKFKHPCGRDFIAIVNEVVARELPEKYAQEFGGTMDWLFDQLIYGTNACDYAVASISNKRMEKELGLFDDRKNCEVPDGEPQNTFQSKVILYRLGEVQLPVDVLIFFEDGTEKMEKWDGKARSYDFQYTGDQKIDCVVIDPNHKIPIDKNSINNSLNLKQKQTGIWKYVASTMIWMQQVMQNVSAFI